MTVLARSSSNLRDCLSVLRFSLSPSGRQENLGTLGRLIDPLAKIGKYRVFHKYLTDFKYLFFFNSRMQCHCAVESGTTALPGNLKLPLTYGT
jgi:hypothetical protein